jgi:hypothetical protein
VAQDYAGALARSVGDIADILNVVSGTDPENPETTEASAHRPADWRSVLDADALKGKRIGILPSAWVDPYGTTTTTDAEKAALKYFKEAGAQLVELPSDPTAPPSVTSDRNWEGWARYIDSHPGGWGHAGEKGARALPRTGLGPLQTTRRSFAIPRAACWPAGRTRPHASPPRPCWSMRCRVRSGNTHMVAGRRDAPHRTTVRVPCRVTFAQVTAVLMGLARQGVKSWRVWTSL